jgi:hypothetical protein
MSTALENKTVFNTENRQIPAFIPPSLHSVLEATYPTPHDRSEYYRISCGEENEVSREFFTPGIAYLAIMDSPGNRRINDRSVLMISDDMQNGNFHPGNDMVLFGMDGRLRNAHHRLLAVMMNGRPVQMFCRRHVPDAEVQVIDQGAKRTMEHSEAMRGMSSPKDYIYNNKNAAIVRIAITRGNQDDIQMSINSRRKAIDFFEPELSFLAKICKDYNHRYQKSASVLAVFLRALRSGVDTKLLEYALRYLMERGESIENGTVQRLNGTSTLRALDHALVTTRSHDSKLIYQKTERALVAFLAGQDLSKIFTSDQELFPIPKMPFLSEKFYSSGIKIDPKNLDVMVQHIKRFENGTEFVWMTEVKKTLPDETENYWKKFVRSIQVEIKRNGFLNIGDWGIVLPVKRPGTVFVRMYTYQRKKDY